VSNTDMWPAQEGTQIKRAALIVHATLVIWQKLYRYNYFILSLRHVIN